MLLALLVLSFVLIFKLVIALRKYESEVYSYKNTFEDLKAIINACQNQIRHTEADLQSIRTDLHNLRVLKSDLESDYVGIMVFQDLNRRLQIANKQKASLEEIETELVSIGDRVNSNLHGGLEQCQFPSVPNNSVCSAS